MPRSVLGCMALLLCSGVYAADTANGSAPCRDAQGKKITCPEVQRATEAAGQSNLARFQASRNSFLQVIGNFDVRGIKMGTPLAEIRSLLAKNFKTVDCRGKVPGEFSNCYGFLQSGNNGLDLSEEEIHVTLSDVGSMATGVHYTQKLPFGASVAECANRATHAANSLVAKYGMPLVGYQKSTDHPWDHMRNQKNSDEITLGWGGVGSVGSPKSGEWAIAASDLKGVSASDFTNGIDVRVLGDGYMANFYCGDRGRATITLTLMSDITSAKHSYRPKPQDAKF